MKKSYIALLGLSAMALVACGGSNGVNVADATIVVWGPNEEQPVVKQIVDEWNAENPDNQIRYTWTSITEADAGTTVAADPTVRGYPSLFACADDHLRNLVSIRRIVNPLGTSAAETIRENDVATAVTAASIDGQLYAYPISVDNGYFLYYDKRVYTEESQVATMESILEIAADQEKNFVMDVGNGYYSASFFMSPDVCGTDSLSYELKTAADGETQVAQYDIDWDSDAGAEMALAASKLMTTYGSASSTQTDTWIGGDDNVLMGLGNNLAACVSGMWMEGHLSSTWGEGNVGATKLPTLAGKQLSSFAGTKLYCVNGYATPDEQQVAHTLARLLTSKEAQLLRYKIRNSIPCNEEAQNDKAYTSTLASNPTVSALQEQSEFAAIQSSAAEADYWTIGEGIGECMRTGAYTVDKVTTTLDTAAKWKTYLTSQLDLLRNPAELAA